MLSKRLILFLLLTSTTLLAVAQEGNSDSLLRETIRQFGQATVTIPLTAVQSINNLTINVSISDVRDKTVYIVLSKITVEWFLLQNYDYTILKREDTKGVLTALNVSEAMDWHSYPSYTQYESIMQLFATSFPAICHLDTIGQSINGKYLLVIKISDNVNINEDEPEVFYSSSIHGDETGGYILMLRLADYLTKNYTNSEEVRTLVNGLEIFINPLANPDGTYASGNTILDPIRFNSNGVDLNRNFPDPLITNQIIEKENGDMIWFMKKHNFVLSANFHAGAEVVNYPWDRWYSKIHADDSWFNSISREYADTVHRYSGPLYMSYLDNGVTRGTEWYIITGGRQDYITYERQGREVTIELDNVKITPPAQLENLWQYNYNSLLNYLKNALYGVHGVVKDSQTLANIKARIFITGHDKDSSHVYSDKAHGRFIRMLSPGLYDLKISASGYKDTIVRNVNVVKGEATNLLVYMEAINTGIENVRNQTLVIFPNPASGYAKIKLPDGLTGPADIKLFDQAGTVVLELLKLPVNDSEISLDLNELSSGIYLITISTHEKPGNFSGKIVILH